MGLDGDRGAGENRIARDFSDEHRDLDRGDEPAKPGADFAGVVVRGGTVFAAGRREMASFSGGDGVCGTEGDAVGVGLLFVVVCREGGRVGRASGAVVGGVDVDGLGRVVSAVEVVVVADGRVGGWKSGLVGEGLVDRGDARAGGRGRGGNGREIGVEPAGTGAGVVVFGSRHGWQIRVVVLLVS